MLDAPAAVGGTPETVRGKNVYEPSGGARWAVVAERPRSDDRGADFGGGDGGFYVGNVTWIS